MRKLRSTLPGAGNTIVIVQTKTRRKKTKGSGLPGGLVQSLLLERLMRPPQYRPLAGQGFKLGGRGIMMPRY